MRKLLTIGEAARLVGVTPKAIRHYHKLGLLPEPERSEAGYRLYGTAELLRLRRIRRLKALGLSLGQVSAALGGPRSETTGGTGSETPLREVLEALRDEVSAEIEKLEERRARIEELLARDDLLSVEDAGGPSPTFEMMRARLGEHLPDTVSAEAWAMEEKIWTTLDAFEWPDGYRETWETLARQFEERPEELRRMVEIGERIIALKELPADSPEVELLAEDLARSVKSDLYSGTLPETPAWAAGPLGAAFFDLLTTELSPAQRRLFELVEEHGTQESEGDAESW